MTKTEARRRATEHRSAIGHILYAFRLMKANRDDWVPGKRLELKKHIKTHQQYLKVLYAMHPDIKPQRGKQLSLFPGR